MAGSERHAGAYRRIRGLDDGANSPEPELCGVKRKNFDVDGTLTVLPFTAVKVGYGTAIRFPYLW